MTAAGAPEPLEVEPVDENLESWDNLEGAGVLSSFADLDSSLRDPNPDPGAILPAAAVAGLDSLGAVMNPLDALAGAGVGWLIEHLAFLHEPLDWLAGDPTQITAQARTWHNMSTELGRVADEYRHSAERLIGWDGVAVDSYRGAVSSYTATVSEAAAHADDLAGRLTNTGAMVGTVRATIRDMIAERVGGLLAEAAMATAAGPVTAGGSVAAFVAHAVAQAAEAAAEIGQKITELLAKLSAAVDELAGMVRRFAAKAAAIGRGLRRVDTLPQHIDGRLVGDFDEPNALTRYLQDAGRPPLPGPDDLLSDAAAPRSLMSEPAHSDPTKAIAELGKQTAEAGQERASWDRDAAART